MSNNKEVTNVKAEVMNVRGSQRAFYRIYVLPLHIEKRDGETRAAMQKELDEHLKFVEENNLQAKLDEYLADQKKKQELYNVWQEAKGEFAVRRGEKNIENFQAVADAQEAAKAAKEAFHSFQKYFKATWH